MQFSHSQRSEMSKALAKAIAYKQCGNDYAANVWASKLLDLLKASYITPQSRNEEVRELLNQY